MERWLDATGERVLTDAFEESPEGLTESRLVFYMHFLVFDRPLLTPGGPISLPPPKPVPARLSGIAYEPVD